MYLTTYVHTHIHTYIVHIHTYIHTYIHTSAGHGYKIWSRVTELLKLAGTWILGRLMQFTFMHRLVYSPLNFNVCNVNQTSSRGSLKFLSLTAR